MKHDDRIRMGAVSYLNTKPLVYQLAQLAPQTKVVFDLPSRLADRLARQQPREETSVLSEKTAERPNIVFVMTDDQGPWALGAAGEMDPDDIIARAKGAGYDLAHLAPELARRAAGAGEG